MPPISTDAAQQLSLDVPWAIGEEGFSALVADLTPLKPGRILEFGSGRSTVRLAHAFPDAQIVTVEHDLEYYFETIALMQRHASAAAVRVEHCPLSYRVIARALYRTYATPIGLPSLDAVIIDGPPSWTGRGREGALYLVAGQLRVGGRVYLDDFERAGERQIVANWQARYPGVFAVRQLRAGHQIAVLEKVAECGPPQRNIGVFVDGIWEFLRLMRGATASRLRKATTS